MNTLGREATTDKHTDTQVDRFVGGIPASIFRPGFREPFAAASGRILNAFVSNRFLIISDPADESVHFRAFVNPDNNDELVLNMGADIRTVRGDGTQHPDFYAGQLLEYAADFFGRHNTLPVTIFEAKWGGDSINYRQFRSAQIQMGQVATQTVLCAIADTKTWTGGVVNRQGFRATEVKDDPAGVAVVFRRSVQS